MSDCLHCIPCSLARVEAALKRLGRIEPALKRMEIAMANEAEQLNVIKARLADVHSDVRAKLEDVRAEVSPEGQAALDEVMQAIESFDSEIGDADGSEVPAPPAEPTDPGTGDVAGDEAR